jgi:AraC-like DNA-binding protein
LVKIALEFEPIPTTHANGHAVEQLATRRLASGDGWSVSDVVCTAGPRHRPFEEQHPAACIAIVASGTFQYRSSAGRELMTPGSLLLGNAGQYYECGHEYAVADRCISFSYEPRYLEEIAADAGVQCRKAHFSTLRVPPVRELSQVVSRACAGIPDGRVMTTSLEHASSSSSGMTEWEEIGIELATLALKFARGGEPSRASFPAAEARVTRIVRTIDSRPDAEHRLDRLAREAKLSRYHLIRVFQQVTALTPHQYILRARLRRAATRLLLEPARVLDIVLDCGFGDVSNFNHAFRAEFGVSPRSYRKSAVPHSQRRA